MSTQPRDLAWTQSSEPLQVDADGVTDYSFFSDEQLAEERDRQQAQLDELKTHAGESAPVRQLRSSIDREVKRMTDELQKSCPIEAPVVAEPERPAPTAAVVVVAPPRRVGRRRIENLPSAHLRRGPVLTLMICAHADDEVCAFLIRAAHTMSASPTNSTTMPSNVYCPWPLISFELLIRFVPCPIQTSPARQSTIPTMPRAHMIDSDPDLVSYDAGRNVAPIGQRWSSEAKGPSDTSARRPDLAVAGSRFCRHRTPAANECVRQRETMPRCGSAGPPR